MAIIKDKVIGNLKGDFDDVLNKWVSPPRLMTLPKTVSFSPLRVAAENFAEDRSIIDEWLKSSPVIEAFCGSNNRELNYIELTVLEGIVQQDVDNIDNPLTPEVGSRIIEIIQIAKSSIENPNGQ